MLLCQVVIGLILISSGYGLPTGAPQEACTTFKPKHKENVAQTSASPYTVTASGNSFSSADDKITVNIVSPDGGPSFKGFLITAKDAQLKQLSGSWKSGGGAHVISACPAVVTHDNNNDKRTVTLEWHPPADATKGMVVMTAAVVHNFTTFWVDIPAKIVSTPIAATTVATHTDTDKNTP